MLVELITGITIIILDARFAFMGDILGLVVALAFLFVMQSVVVSGKGAIDALKDSYHVGIKNHPWDILAAWLLMTVFSMFIMILFFIPLLLIVATTVPLDGTLEQMLSALSSARLSLIAGFLIFLLGNSFLRLLSLAFLTQVYRNLRK